MTKPTVFQRFENGYYWRNAQSAHGAKLDVAKHSPWEEPELHATLKLPCAGLPGSGVELHLCPYRILREHNEGNAFVPRVAQDVVTLAPTSIESVSTGKSLDLVGVTRLEVFVPVKDAAGNEALYCAKLERKA